MKKLFFVLAFLVTMGSISTANATLWDRGGGLIYDDVLGITWLQDANYAMTSGDYSGGLTTWINAVAWADGLVYGDFDDWRLPSAGPEEEYYNVTSSEMGYMYYVNLGNVARNEAGWTGTPKTTFTDGKGNEVSFQNLQSYYYWSGTESSLYANHAWAFGFSHGYQGGAPIGYYYYHVWAVRDGDVAPVPEPATFILLACGLLGLTHLARKESGKN